MTDWRTLRYRHGKARLWEQHGGQVLRSCCRRMAVIDLVETTMPIVRDQRDIQKCRLCLAHEQRLEEAA